MDGPLLTFARELTAVPLEILVRHNSQLVVIRKFSLHMEDPGCPCADQLTAPRRQFQNEATRHSAPTLTNGGCLNFSHHVDECGPVAIEMELPLVSDHGLLPQYLYFCPLMDGSQSTEQPSVKSCLTSAVFVGCLQRPDTFPVMSCSTSTTLRSALSSTTCFRRAPSARHIRCSHLTPWFDSECKALRRTVRLQESKVGQGPHRMGSDSLAKVLFLPE